MNKKRLQRLGVVCMAAAMVLTTVSFPRVAKAEGETLTQADASTSTEQETGKVLMQVNPTVLQTRAMCNSQQNNPIKDNDGLASWAFDEENHWWHSRWTGTKDPSEDTINETVRPWIGSGFGQAILLKKVTYQGRGGTSTVNNSIKNYSLYYADTPKTTPDSSDWILAERGSFTESSEAQEIVLDQAVRATHFKLVAESTINWEYSQDKSTCAKNIKVYAEDTLNLTVTAPVNNQQLTKVDNEAFDPKVTTVKDISESPIDTSAARVNNDGTFSGQIVDANVSKLNDLQGTTPFMIRMKVKLNDAPDNTYILINRGDEPYQIAYGIENGTPKIKFQMCQLNDRTDANGQGWHEVKVNVASKVGQEIDILALYTGKTMGLWVDGERFNDYERYNVPVNDNDSNNSLYYTMTSGTNNALQIGATNSPASIKSVQVVKDIGRGLSINANYNNLVIPAFNRGTRLLELRVVEGMTDHQYTLDSKWTNTTEGNDITGTTAVNTDGAIDNYRAVVTATPKGSLKFTDASMPQTLKVKVDASGTIADVPVTSSSVDDTTGVLKITYDFEELFIGGSLRMDYQGYDQTSMRYGYDFKLPNEAQFAGCVWYYGMFPEALTTPFEPSEKTNYIIYQNNGEEVYRSNIVFTGIGKANYDTNVYSRILVKYTVGEKTYSKMGSFIDTRTVKQVAEKINESTSGASKAQKDYAQGILNAMRDN